MNNNQILELLKTIKYPGFNRDIVSFGMIKDIMVNEDSVEIYLNISAGKVFPAWKYHPALIQS